ncbi:PREDICTED: histone-lysine N-methyltransferase SETDB2-like, partial [Gekko japonicus]|uniref:Histone-lysine N-methyltransferase SETDB2-like n=1 Tax=Gekko japonicus TaxID=146911 RepID=A0ABM1KU66_GEKJA
RLMSRAGSRPAEAGVREAKEEDAGSGDRSRALSPKKRKADSACSDSEVEFVQTTDSGERRSLPVESESRLMSRAGSRQAEAGVREAKEEDAGSGDRSRALSPKKRKADSACSDSEVEFVQTTDSGERRSLPVESESQPNVIQTSSCNDQNWSDGGIKRPQTRTSVLQSRRRKLGITDATSSEDEGPVCHSLARRRLDMGTTKGGKKPSVQGEFREQATAGLSDAEADHPGQSPLPSPSLPCKPLGQDEGSGDKQPMSIFRTDGASEEESGSGRQELAREEAAERKASTPKQFDREDLCLLDATKEGNVGRFLNHSCCPNLFVQSVFVETHNRNFPWVAFFTNRHIKAGTELTWDYGYLPGSMPETEIPCQCGSHKCRKKIL